MRKYILLIIFILISPLFANASFVKDTTNLSDDEKEWYFHANPSLDQLDPNFNPHFDNVEI